MRSKFAARTALIEDRTSSLQRSIARVTRLGEKVPVWLLLAVVGSLKFDFGHSVMLLMGSGIVRVRGDLVQQ